MGVPPHSPAGTSAAFEAHGRAGGYQTNGSALGVVSSPTPTQDGPFLFCRWGSARMREDGVFGAAFDAAGPGFYIHSREQRPPHPDDDHHDRPGGRVVTLSLARA